MGVGPGHPGLATVQAIEAIKEADFIRRSDGCGAALLHHARPGTDIGALDDLDEVVRLARQGRKVTVLFPGNPYAFSNGSAMAERLQRSGVDFEAVPGLILELAAPVMSGIPLTIEGRSASIGFGLVKGAETVVLRLASGWWESGITTLLADGRKPSTPAQATVQRLAVMTMPARHKSISEPQIMNGQARRTKRSAVASKINDAGSWQKFSAVSAALIRSGRPASVR